MAEVLGGSGENSDTRKFNGVSNTKEESVPIKQEEDEIPQQLLTAQLSAATAANYLATQLSVQISSASAVQERACVKMPVQSNAGMPKHDKACAPQPQHKIKTIKKKKTEDEEEEKEDSSPSDYEYTLRVENIRLKSRLEQAKEGMLSLEKQCKKVKEELEKEKKFGDKANSTIFSLMQEKQSLADKLKRAPQALNSAHTEGIQEVVGKLEHEIQVLEERLDSQRKRYHQEHVLMYEDLKEERIKRQEWKQTYLKSQCAVMAFRRKLSLMKDRISEEDTKELTTCLELVFHEQDGHLKQDLITKKEEGCVEGNSKYAAHITNLYKTTNVMEVISQSLLAKGLSNSKNTDSNDNSTTAPVMSASSQLVSLKHALEEEEKNDGEASSPKVFIMSEEDELIDPTIVPTPPAPAEEIIKLSTNSNAHTKTISSNQRYELDSNKHHQSYIQSLQQRQASDRSPQYKHWHHYSVDNPGHNPGQNRNKLNVIGTLDNLSTDKKSLASSLQRINDQSSYKSKFSKYGFNDQLDLNVNDTTFLNLNFDQAFLKGSTVVVSTNLTKALTQKNGISSVDGSMKKSDEGGKKLLYCVTCDKDVPNRSCGHTNILVQEREKEFPCPTCSRVFTNRSHLKRHNMIHSGEKPFACTYCEKRFNRKSHLSRHLLTHTGEKPFKCPVCEKGFADNSDLKRHKQIHDNHASGLVNILPKNKNSVQPTLLPSFTASDPLTHQNLSASPSMSSEGGELLNQDGTKKKDVRYPCNKCAKTFSRKSHLTRHKLTHEKIKIYCDCGRLFRQNAHLQAHLPSCIRKREAVEADYLAKSGPNDGDIPLEASQTDGASETAVQSVDDFQARLNAKFNNGENNFNLEGREMKEEIMSETNSQDSLSFPSSPQDESMMEENSDVLQEGIKSEIYEEKYVASLSPDEDVANQFVNNSENIPLNQKTEVLDDDNFDNDPKLVDQKLSDINFNLIVKNGSPKLQNDDLMLGVDTLPTIPLEIPPLLNE